MRAGLVLVLAASIANADALAPVATVSAGGGTPEERVIGDRWVALTGFRCDADDCFVDVADTLAGQVERVHASRALLEKKFGHASGAYRSIEATLVFYDGHHSGWLVVDRDNAAAFHWYAELDAKTGRVARATRLDARRDERDLYPIGFDPAHGAVWFYELEFAGPREPARNYGRERSAHELRLRRIDLADLAVDAVATLTLPARVQKQPLEDEISFHVAPDFSRIAFVEYYEEPHRLSPPASAYVIDTSDGSSFAVAIPQVVYAATFDSKYLYLSSSVTGEIRRIDLAKHAVDRVVHGPKQSHHAVITPDGKRMLVLSTSKRFVAYDLPELTRARELPHDASLGEAFRELGPSSLAVLGGRLVLPLAWGESTRDYAIVDVSAPDSRR
jgi:hypothetical protein